MAGASVIAWDLKVRIESVLKVREGQHNEHNKDTYIVREVI